MVRDSFRLPVERDGFAVKGVVLRVEGRVRSLRETQGIAKCISSNDFVACKRAAGFFERLRNSKEVFGRVGQAGLGCIE